jgi:hypothetical protein
VVEDGVQAGSCSRRWRGCRGLRSGRGLQGPPSSGMLSSSLMPKCTRCRTGHVGSGLRPGRWRGPEVSGGTDVTRGPQGGRHPVRLGRDVGRPSPAQQSPRTYGSTAAARFGDGGAAVGGWRVSIMLSWCTSRRRNPRIAVAANGTQHRRAENPAASRSLPRMGSRGGVCWVRWWVGGRGGGRVA